MVLVPVLLAVYTQADKPTLNDLRAKYLNQTIIVSGTVSHSQRQPALVDWSPAKATGSIYRVDLSGVPAGIKGNSAKIIAVQLHRASRTTVNALGEMVADDNTADPYVDVIARLPDGQLIATSGYAFLLEVAIKLVTDQIKEQVDVEKAIPAITGKKLYAVELSRLYPPDSSLEDMTDLPTRDRMRLGTLPLLEPLEIVTVRYIEQASGVVLKLRLPDGSYALTFNDRLAEQDGLDILGRVAGTLLASIPSDLTSREIEAIKHRSPVKGMSVDALHYALGLPEKDNLVSEGNHQLVYYGGRVYVYLDHDRVTDWQTVDR